MRSAAVTLTAILVLIVLLTSFVLDDRQSAVPRVSVGAGRIDAIPSGPGLLRDTSLEQILLLSGQTVTREPIRDLLVEVAGLCRKGEFGGAAARLKAALTERPDDLAVLEVLANISFALGDYSQAEECLQRCLDLGHRLGIEPRRQLGVAQMYQGKYEGALANLGEALRRDPADGVTHFALACVHSRMKHADRGLDHLEVAHAQLGLALLTRISDPLLDNLRHSPRFGQIVSSVRPDRRGRVGSAPDAHPASQP